MPICGHCGFEPDPGTVACPLCGSRLAPGDPVRGARPGLPPWEDPTRSSLGGLIDTWRASLFEPAAFFRGVGTETAFSRPLLYFLAVTVIGASFTLWWQAVGVPPTGLEAYARGPTTGTGTAPALLAFFLSPFAALIGLTVWTLLLHLFVLVLVPEPRPVGATARLLCYAAGPTVFAAVPLAGPLVALGWITVMDVVGVREVHGTSTGRAAAAVLLPAGLALLALLLLLVLLVLAAGAPLLEPYA